MIMKMEGINIIKKALFSRPSKHPTTTKFNRKKNMTWVSCSSFSKPYIKTSSKYKNPSFCLQSTVTERGIIRIEKFWPPKFVKLSKRYSGKGLWEYLLTISRFLNYIFLLFWWPASFLSTWHPREHVLLLYFLYLIYLDQKNLYSPIFRQNKWNIPNPHKFHNSAFVLQHTSDFYPKRDK